MAAGNRALVKLSELTPRFSAAAAGGCVAEYFARRRGRRGHRRRGRRPRIRRAAVRPPACSPARPRSAAR
ncbi:MAG: hypothetical protein MZW92_00030 [Comamonadaceae bacterium]|nr:hypothetical protein [Comamonadaceae bacterium]